MIALESAAEGLVAFALPDFCDWLLEYIAQHALFLVLFCTFVSKRREAAGEHVAAGSDIGQRVRAPATRPGPFPKIAYQALHRSCGASRAKSNTALPACLFATAYEFQFLARGTSEERLLRCRQSFLKIDQALHIDFFDPGVACQVNKLWQILQIFTHGCEPQ